jgi:hypothetical protein
MPATGVDGCGAWIVLAADAAIQRLRKEKKRGVRAHIKQNENGHGHAFAKHSADEQRWHGEWHHTENRATCIPEWCRGQSNAPNLHRCTALGGLAFAQPWSRIRFRPAKNEMERVSSSSCSLKIAVNQLANSNPCCVTDLFSPATCTYHLLTIDSVRRGGVILDHRAR